MPPLTAMNTEHVKASIPDVLPGGALQAKGQDFTETDEHLQALKTYTPEQWKSAFIQVNLE